jgi:hypothetical protein
LYCILLTTLELFWLYFFRKKPDMTFIILVSNLEDISPSVFSWKKRIYKKLRCNSTVKIRFGRKKILNYAYVLKNGVGRYNIFFNFYTKLAESSFLCRFRVESVNVLVCAMCFFFATNNFAHAQTLYRMRSLCRSYEYCAGKHWILYWIQENKTATYFLRSRLFTYDIMKNFNCN